MPPCTDFAVFSITIEQRNPSCWTPEVEESWQTMFRFVIVFMKVGTRDSRAKAEKAAAAAADGAGDSRQSYSGPGPIQISRFSIMYYCG